MKYQKIIYKIIILSALLISLSLGLHAQNETWDDPQREKWPKQFKEIEIPSSVDDSLQKAYYYQSTQEKPQPLIVSLHTWSNSYNQNDPLIQEVLDKDYNYIRPDFRGPNYTYQACGSPLVASDIDDAISYAIAQGNIDTNNIHVIGVSGGGHATLIAYMKSRHNIKTFSSWVPISDVAKWYYESKGRDTRYARHISLATTRKEDAIDIQEAIQRSPLHMQTPIKDRKDSRLYLYAGIHDGHDGSVPISHSLEMYNKLVKDFDPNDKTELIPQEVIQQLTITRYMPGDKYGKISDRTIHYKKRYQNKLQIVIFEGGHEMLTDVALKNIPSQTILTIGDSNGANPKGWVYQLSQQQFNNTFINTSISGNTIGFDNNGYEIKNTLKNILNHLNQHDPGKNRLGQILIMLGTNDCKKVFNSRMEEIPQHCDTLITIIKRYYSQSRLPAITMISPPPVGVDAVLKEKYHGGAQCVAYLNKAFKKVAGRHEVRYIDLYSILQPTAHLLLRDGIHFNEEGYQLVGFLLDQKLKNQK